MAAAQAMWNVRCRPSSGPSSSGLAESLLEDMDLRWQVDRLGEQPPEGVPRSRVGASAYRFSGDEPHEHVGEATDAAAQSARQLDRAGGPSCSTANFAPLPCPRWTWSKVARHLGDDAAKSLDRLAKLAKQLADAGLIEQRGEVATELTPQGHPPHLGQQALSDLFGPS